MSYAKQLWSEIREAEIDSKLEEEELPEYIITNTYINNPFISKALDTDEND